MLQSCLEFKFYDDQILPQDNVAHIKSVFKEHLFIGRAICEIKIRCQRRRLQQLRACGNHESMYSIVFSVRLKLESRLKGQDGCYREFCVDRRSTF